MRTFVLFALLVLVLGPLAGCLVRTHGHGHGNGHSSARRGGARSSCGPAYHWNGNRCVHNGRGHAKGHRK